MDGKAKYLFPVLAAAVIVFFVSSVITFANIGFRADFVTRWLSAFIIRWPVGAVLGFFLLPQVAKLSAQVVALIEGKLDPLPEMIAPKPRKVSNHGTRSRITGGR